MSEEQKINSILSQIYDDIFTILPFLAQKKLK